MAREISPFPFDQLKHYTAAECDYMRRLALCYPLVRGATLSLQELVRPLNRLVPSDFSVRFISLSLESAENLTKDLPEKMIICILRKQPSGERAFFVMESLLGQVLAQATLTAGQINASDVAALTLEPVTPLVEAVIQYAVAEVMDKMQTLLGEKSFGVVIESVATNGTALKAVGDYFRVVLALRILDRDFFIQVWLPETKIVSEFTDGITQEARTRHRLIDFSQFPIDALLQVGSVSLIPDELSQVSEGDIILFDKSSLHGVGENISGSAALFLGDPRDLLGYSVEIKKSAAGEIVAVVAGGL